MRLEFGNDLHCTHLRRTRQRARRKRIDECLNGICALIKLSADTAYEMHHVRVILQILVEINLDVVAIARKIVARKVHQHHMFGILLRVIAQELGSTAVDIGITRATCSACNRVDVSLTVLYTAMSFGRRAEYAEPSEVEVEQVRTGIDAAQCAVELEVVALKMLYEAARYDHLKHVATQTMLYSASYVGTMLVVGEWRSTLAYGTKSVVLAHSRIERQLHSIKSVVATECDERHATVEMVDHDNVPIHYI